MLDTEKRVERIDAGNTAQCTIRLKNGESFSVHKNELLLMGALRQGISYPHTCTVGTCGRCKTKLSHGRISPLVDFALSPLTNRELEQGYVLACQAKVRTDLDIDVTLLDHDLILPRPMAGEITGWRLLDGDVIDLRVRFDEAFTFQPGQYGALAVSGSYVRRSFSFYDPAPGPEGTREVGFLIKRLPQGRFSDWLARFDRRGVRIWMEAPFGQMGIDDVARDAVCVGGGTGISPVLSIAHDRLTRFPKNKVIIIFGVRSQADLFALGKLDAVKLRAPKNVTIIPILSHEPAGSAWRGRRGLVTDAINENLKTDLTRAAAFVCGNLPMVVAVEDRLKVLGMPEDQIHADKFEPSGL